MTAEHLLDWSLPGYENKAARKKKRASEILLQVTSHLANSAKHLTVEDAHHKSAKENVRRHAYFGNWFENYMGPRELVVLLDGDAAVQLGRSIRALALAHKVMGYWNGQSLNGESK